MDEWKMCMKNYVEIVINISDTRNDNLEFCHPLNHFQELQFFS